MEINTNRRWFRLKPEAKAKFLEYLEDARVAAGKKLDAARAAFINWGVPEEVAESIGLFENFSIGIPAGVYPHLKGTLNKPKNGYCQLHATRSDAVAIRTAIDGVKIPSVDEYLPTLGIGRMWFLGNVLIRTQVVKDLGTFYLTGIPKASLNSDGYEPDLDLLEELTLAEWAKVVQEAVAREEAEAAGEEEE